MLQLYLLGCVLHFSTVFLFGLTMECSRLVMSGGHSEKESPPKTKILPAE